MAATDSLSRSGSRPVHRCLTLPAGFLAAKSRDGDGTVSTAAPAETSRDQQRNAQLDDTAAPAIMRPAPRECPQMAKRKTRAMNAEAALLAFALSLPEASEEWPWGERVVKVRGKIFVFLGMVEADFRLGVKLPISAEMALTLPFCQPSGYGLGRAGWITARFPPGEKPPVDLLRGWIEQSYRAIAPKRLAKLLNGERRR
jgi:predicted DNA-binding protein (MmcQ/YjbR family)